MEKDIYYGNELQIRGVEQYKLLGGKEEGLRMINIKNGLGLDVTLCPDRCLDITKVIYKGDNLGYFSPCGNVSPTYYDANDAEMVRSFTGGFLTTCGFDNVGVACEVVNTKYPLHGRISNQPANYYYYEETDTSYEVHATITQAALFLDKLELKRKIIISKEENTIKLEDKIQNKGEYDTACMVLYHMNMGYPLLSEDAILSINSISKKGRDDLATKLMDSANEIKKPMPNTQEVCYFHEFDKSDISVASIYNNKIKKGVEISFDSNKLPYFTQWNMFGKYDYVLGLEPGNCLPQGRQYAKENNMLKALKEKESVVYNIEIKIKGE